MRARIAEPEAGVVPRELLAVGDRTWSDPVLFSRWCRRIGIEEPDAHTWAERFQRGLARWADLHGFSAGYGRPVDQERLRALGVPFSGSLHRAWALTDTPPPSR